nr:MAG: protein of unknown function (DUF2498) [Bacteriophage sp.]
MTEIPKENMLSIANSEIATIDGYFEGLSVTAVTQENDFIVFRGETFTDSCGLPSEKTKPALKVYRKLTEKYSPLYKLS